MNDEIRQDSSTSDMVISVFELISMISDSITLEEGDLISTGTPAGVGLFSKTKGFLENGDEVLCEIEGIGQLKNKVLKI